MTPCPTNKQILALHAHTGYSLLDGASSIDDYVAWTKENKLPALGITDHGWATGCLELIDKCNKEGIAPFPGIEFYVVPDDCYKFAKKKYDYYHVCAWATNEVGYRNILKLASLSFTELLPNGKKRVITKMFEGKPRITIDELLENNEGLIVGTACVIGVTGKAILQGEDVGAEYNLLRFMSGYKDRLFVEILPHSVDHDYSRKLKKFVKNEEGDIQKLVNLKNIDLAKKYSLPLLMTLDSHFVKPEDHDLQSCLLKNGNPDGWHFYNNYSLMSTEKAWDFWSKTYGDDENNRKIFAESVENNYHFASLSSGIKLKEPYRLPDVEIPQEIVTRFSDENTQLKALLLEKVNKHGRMKWGELEWEKRLAYELNVICDNGILNFSKYFLFLEEWCEWTRKNSILSAPGRGSAAGSLLCYLLKITHINPFQYNLPFERFLSMGRLKRGRYPDIDWDQNFREVLIAKLNDVYGDKMAQCCTHGTLKIKSAIKDACRVILGWNSQDVRVDSVSKSVAMAPMGVKDIDFLMGYVDGDGVSHEGHLDVNTKLRDFFNSYPQVKDMVSRLLGIPRSIGRHASSFMISNESIWKTVPTCNIGGVICTQYTAGPCEKAGLIKFDFLRVNTLADISSCVRLVQQRLGYGVWKDKIITKNESFEILNGNLGVEQLPMKDGRVFDLYNLPEDEHVFNDFALGKTETVFQMNTPLLTEFCKRVRPKNINDIGALVALVRPGPLSALIEDNSTTMTEAYIKRRDGKMPVVYIHPDMEPILKSTYAVICFQEQMMAIFSDLLGYSPEEADQIRELLAKKKRQDLEKVIPEIRQRCLNNKWSKEQAETLVGACVSAANYSFNFSHSISYSMVAYQCMFLKHHYPLEWWTAVLQNAKVEDIKDKNYAHVLKDKLELPHINGPMDTFELKGDRVHAPLYLIDGVGDSACKSIREEQKNGPFVSFFDFYDRCDKRAVDQNNVHAMILCGAFRFVSGESDNKSLLELYHGLRRVQELKIGKGKKGIELLTALSEYTRNGGKVDVPSLYQDPLELEIKRLQLLPIYRVDVHVYFKDFMEKKGFLYDANGVQRIADKKKYIVVSNVKEAPKWEHREIGYAGLIQKTEDFTYKDKRTRQQVTALKVYVSNDGDSIECVFWPDAYEMIKKETGAFPLNQIIFVRGILKEAREPGKWTISVQGVDFL